MRLSSIQISPSNPRMPWGSGTRRNKTKMAYADGEREDADEHGGQDVRRSTSDGDHQEQREGEHEAERAGRATTVANSDADHVDEHAVALPLGAAEDVEVARCPRPGSFRNRSPRNLLLPPRWSRARRLLHGPGQSETRSTAAKSAIATPEAEGRNPAPTRPSSPAARRSRAADCRRRCPGQSRPRYGRASGYAE